MKQFKIISFENIKSTIKRGVLIFSYETILNQLIKRSFNLIFFGEKTDKSVTREK
jgi:hypothetical protein